jgi:hypothetical protein
MVLVKHNGETETVALNSNTQSYFANLLMYGDEFKKIEEWGSDKLDRYDFDEIKQIRVVKYKKPKREFKDKSGGFFTYINNSDIDLSEQQIYTQEQALNIGQREHCLIKALDDVEKSLINKVKLAFATNSNINRKDLKIIAEMIGQDIILYHYDNEKDNIRKVQYKTTSTKKPLEIAIYKNHYFKYEKTKYSLYSIKNYEELRGEPEFYNIYKKGRRSPYKSKINTLKLVHMLFLKGYFIRGDLSKFEEIHNTEIRDDIYLDRIDEEQQLIEYKEYDRKIRNIYYADCESFVYEPIHKLYLLGYVSDKNDITTILNVQDMPTEELITKWLNDMTNGGKKDVLCYFHNLKYDYHLLEKFLPIQKKCVKDNTLYSVKLLYRKRKIELRDSYKLLSFPLSKFGKNLNLPANLRKKEAIAYEYYRPENNDISINTADYKKLLSTDDQKIFDKLVKDYSHEGTFNPLTYYKDYLNLDCLVLKYGLQKFNEIIKQITDNELNIYDCLTISSLTDRYMKINGAYEGVYEVKDNLRAYIAKAVYGGRVCVNEKYKKKVVEGKISDYDGVSLYPSAINRLCREIGLPKGKAQRMKNFSEWNNYTYSIMTVKINKVNKKQQMPFIAYKTDTGTEYMNEPPPEPVIIDKITLEDYINFHHIEYEILDGVYWNEGGNPKMGELIQKLFNERLKHKKNNPALANTLKLMLNSAYGKTIMKKSKSETKIINVSKSADKFNRYIYNNFYTIKKYRKINEYYYEVEKTAYDDSYNTGQVGAFILSYSKRIMNEVFNTANDCEYPIYYTDTDSIHLNYEDVAPLEKKYREIYNKELNGKNLEQFHIDFDLNGAVEEIYATKSIFLGKKSYIDYLESKDEKGNKINGCHYRLKGITKEGLEHSAKKCGGYFKLYEELARGEEKEIILNPFNKEKNKSKVLFEFKNGQVSTKKEFIRKVKF